MHLFNWITSLVLEQKILLDYCLNRLLLLTGEFLILEPPWTGISPNLNSVFVLKLDYYFHTDSAVILWLFAL